MDILQDISEEQRGALRDKLEKLLQPTRCRETAFQQDETDGRSAFDSDFSRLAMSAPVRRLKDKTQVFPLPEYDFVRNRLTHSLEVMTIARGLGLGVEKVLRQNGLYPTNEKLNQCKAMAEILADVALVHDIGNPPFGHQIEKCIQTYFEKIPSPFIKQYYQQLTEEQQRDFCFIEGNSQGFRVLSHLGLAKDGYSFNLTLPVLATIVKYPNSSVEVNKEAANHEQTKLGYLQSERDVYEYIHNTLSFESRSRHPLTYLLEAADDIAYLVCDVEDGFRNENISIENIQDSWRDAAANYEQIAEIINQLAEENDEVKQQVLMQSLRIQLQSKMIIACTKCFCANYAQILDGTYHKELVEEACPSLQNFCKNLAKFNISDQLVKEKEQEGKEAVIYLLEGFLSAILLLQGKDGNETTFASPEYQLYSKISPNYRKVACEGDAKIPTEVYKMFLLATDYIFGMTDHFLIELANDHIIRDLIMRVQCKVDALVQGM